MLSPAATAPRSSAGTTAPAPTGTRCSGSGSPAARCTSCARRSPTAPASFAEIALALGRAQINIVDIALSPSRDGSQGVVALWIRGEEAAARAVELIAALGIPVAAV